MINQGQPQMRERAQINDFKGTVKRLVRYLGANKAALVAVLILSVVTTLLNLLIPSLIGRAVDTLAMAKDMMFDMRMLAKTLTGLGAVLGVTALLSYFQGVNSAKLTQAIALHIRKELSVKITKLPIGYLDTRRNGDVMARLTNDVENIAVTISQTAGALLSAVVVIVGCVVIMLIQNWELALVSISPVILSVILTRIVSGIIHKIFQKQQAVVGKLSGHIQESVSAHKTVHAYDMIEETIEEHNKISDELTKLALKAQVIGGLLSPLTSLLGNINFLLVVVVGGLFYMNGVPGVTIGLIQEFTLYSRQFTKPVNELTSLFAQFQTAIASAERVFEVLDVPDEPDDGTQVLELESLKGNITFEDVSFSYVPGVMVLDHFSAEIGSGKKVALVGSTGAGKTTLVNLLLRFYEPDSGRILLDGVDIRDIPKRNLRMMITMVLQNTSLMEDTVAANIGYGKFGANGEQIKDIAKVVCADSFINQLPEGYDTMLSSDDSTLSQGQRQLICLGRAALKLNKILVLDEAMSSVDTATEQTIQSTLEKISQGQTSLIIAHRLSTIRDADNILVLENGHVAEEGDHETLIAKRGTYYRLYNSYQYSE